MSIIVAPIVAHATIAAAQRKLFTAQSFTGMVDGFVPFADNEPVKPSFIKMNKATAAAAMGGKASPVSFVSGLLFNVAAFAYGQGKVDALVQGLPPVSAFAVRHACELVKFGAGIDAATLKAATLSSLAAVCALPLKAKTESAKVDAPTIEGTSTRVDDCDPVKPLSTDEIKEAAAMLQGAGDNEAAARIEAEETAAAAAAAARIEAEEAAAAAAAIAAQTREAYILAKAAERVADIAINRAIAASEFVMLAETFGVKLSAAQQKKVDAFVADGDAAADSAAQAAMEKTA